MISDRILLALDINPERELGMLDWKLYLKFIKTVIYYDSPRSELTKFIINVKLFLFPAVHVI